VTPEPQAGRQLSAGSCAALLYASALFVVLVAVQVLIWFLPTDGALGLALEEVMQPANVAVWLRSVEGE
jgi:hypothetical protein